jgi:hypothetical protein
VARVQYDDNVVGPGSPKYDEAYFEINYVRAYTTQQPAPTPPSVPVGPKGSNTVVRVAIPTGVFSGSASSVNMPSRAVARGADMVDLGLLGVPCSESL